MPLDRRETRDWLRPGGPTCLRPNPTPHHGLPIHHHKPGGPICLRPNPTPHHSHSTPHY
uniref:Serine/threonine-protein phosphatase 2A 55 kDa regulatory subunit B n=1 Tax=Mesocestoides corti TaxID=53468 RepID=A0A5K3FQ83_MESCO